MNPEPPDIKTPPASATNVSGSRVIGLGAWWTNAGRALLGLSLASTILMILHVPLDRNAVLRHDPLSILAVFGWITCGLMALFWMVIDIIDRRKKFAWLLPIWVCGISAMVWVPLALYLFVARKES